MYDRWSPLVYSLALRSVGDVARAERVTQRVFTRAWAARATYDPALARFSDWLVDLTRDCIGGAGAVAGRADVVASPFDADDFGQGESKTGGLAERLVVADGMSHLDTLSQRVLRMALDHDLTLAEIAERTGLRVEEVRSQVAAGLMELRQRLEVQVDAH
ncbi:sigma-70 family RNA polymerase sigma factor [Microlunatus spumicola]|uniref:sigma-70 family RNA polymerase sigma factor n=1 Tax=Microlunatus spumicola TaxID=81499 RepID=UPI0031DF41A3